MPQCPRCAHHLVRTHRNPLQRLLFADRYECRHCGYGVKRLRSELSGTLGFVLARRSVCLNCGNPRVQRLTKKDRIDSVSRHPLSLLFGLTGAPINRCPMCRLQYRDWRRPSRSHDDQ